MAQHYQKRPCRDTPIASHNRYTFAAPGPLSEPTRQPGVAHGHRMRPRRLPSKSHQGIPLRQRAHTLRM